MRFTGEARRIWTAPAIIASVSLVSLIGALITEDTILDALAASALCLTLAYAVGSGLSRREHHAHRKP